MTMIIQRYLYYYQFHKLTRYIKTRSHKNKNATEQVCLVFSSNLMTTYIQHYICLTSC